MKKLLINQIKESEKIQKDLFFTPTPFDNYSNQLLLIDKFIEREFYLLINDCIYNRIDYQFTNKLYKTSYVSFLIMMSKNVKEKNLEDNFALEKDIQDFKTFFLLTIQDRCLLKISPILKTIFYRYYTRTPIPKLTLIKKESIFKNFFKFFKKFFKKEKQITEEIENAYNSMTYSLYTYNDQELARYITDYVTMKLSFLIDDLNKLRMKIISNDNRLSILSNLELDNWGEYDYINYSLSMDKTSPYNIELTILASIIEEVAFIDKLKVIFDYNNYNQEQKNN